MAVKKLSEIALSGSPLAQADHLVGVRADNIDLLYSLEQVTRDRLTADRGYYVDNTTGSDSNPGTALLPFATLQYAWDHLSGTLDLGQSNLTINLIGSVTPYTCSGDSGWIGGSSVSILGEDSATTTLVDFALGATTYTDLGTFIRLDGVTCTESENGFNIYNGAIGTLFLPGSDLVFGNTVSEFAHIGVGAIANAGSNSIIVMDHGYTIASSAAYHWFVSFGGLLGGATEVTFDGSIDFTGAFAGCNNLAQIVPFGFSIVSGAATGKRFDVFANGVINIAGGDPTGVALPGDIGGTIESGGQYIGIISERILLRADADYYVDNTTGSDSNDGSIGAPFATLQYTWDHLSGTLDLGQSALNINVLNSATPYLLDTPNSFIGGSRINIVGESIASTQIDISLDLVAQSAEITLDKFTTVDFGISLTGNSKYYIGINDGISFTNASSIRLFRRPICTIGADLSIDATERENFILCSGPGTILDDFSFTATIVGTPNFTGAFVQCYDLALCNLDFIISGSATGKRFEVLSNAVINVGGDPNFFPGDVAGTIASGGQYIGIISERILLRADADYYVDNTTGSNSNQGTAAAPFATLQYAWDHLSGTLDLGQSGLTINCVASGTPYTLDGSTAFIGGGNVIILGDSSATTTINDLFFGFGQIILNTVFVNQVTLADGGSGYCLQQGSANASIDIGTVGVAGDVVIGPAAIAQIYLLASQAVIINENGMTIAGDAPIHLLMDNTTNFVSIFSTVVSSGAVDFSDVFIRCENGSSFSDLFLASDYSGVTATGKRFDVSGNSVIKVGGNPNYFPGDVAGTFTEGGRYIGLEAVAIADLPTGAPIGERQVVNDALAPAFGVAVAASGAAVTPVFWNGSNWIVG